MAIKKIDPYVESARLNELSPYSRAWRRVKKILRKIVKISPPVAPSILPSRRLKWDQVTVNLELNRTTVLRRGTPTGSRAITPRGGHTALTSTTGFKLE